MKLLDLYDAKDNLNAFIKTRAALDGSETVFWWGGEIRSMIPEETSRLLFGFEGFNIARAVPVENGYRLLTREMSVYKSPETGNILESWDNPFTGHPVQVVSVWNDPVNTPIELTSPFVTFPLPVAELGDHIGWNLDVYLTYPSPLSRAEYPDYAQSDLYQGAELFQFFAKRSDLEDPSITNAPGHISWTRISQWLPWMGMGQRAGNLVYRCAGYKLENGIDDLPGHLRRYVEQTQPKFLSAPDHWTAPNETSWTYFKKLVDHGDYPAGR